MKIRTLITGSLILLMILPLFAKVIWTPVLFPATGEEISTLGLDANGNLFVGTMGNVDILVGTPEGIFRSDDEEATWNLVIGGNLPIDDIRVLLDGGNWKLFAGTDNHGVFRSYDNGLAWVDVNFGLPDMKDNGRVIYSFPSIWYIINQILVRLYVYSLLQDYAIFYQMLGWKDGSWTLSNDSLPANPHISCQPLQNSGSLSRTPWARKCSPWVRISIPAETILSIWKEMDYPRACIM